MSDSPKIYLISAGRMSMGPAECAFLEHWPQVRPVHLLDESIFSDAARLGTNSRDMLERFDLLGKYCAAARADAVLFTCSAFAEAIGRVKRAQCFPVLTPNEALFDRLLEVGDRTAILVTFEPSVASLRSELETVAASRGVSPRVDFHFIPDAFNGPDHDRKVVEACCRLAPTYRTLAFGQFSMVTAASAARSRCQVPILDTPSESVQKLKRLLQG